MSLASLALGFGLGVLSTGLLVTVGGAVAASVAWRWARAVERTGFDLAIKTEK